MGQIEVISVKRWRACWRR